MAPTWESDPRHPCTFVVMSLDGRQTSCKPGRPSQQPAKTDPAPANHGIGAHCCIQVQMDPGQRDNLWHNQPQIVVRVCPSNLRQLAAEAARCTHAAQGPQRLGPGHDRNGEVGFAAPHARGAARHQNTICMPSRNNHRRFRAWSPAQGGERAPCMKGLSGRRVCALSLKN